MYLKNLYSDMYMQYTGPGIFFFYLNNEFHPKHLQMQ